MRCEILEPDYKESGQQAATEQLLARSVIFQISRKIYDRPIEELYYDYTKGKKYLQATFDDLETVVLEKNDALYGDAFND